MLSYILNWDINTHTKLVTAYVCAEAGLLVTLQTRYFLLMGPAWVTSTFRPRGRETLGHVRKDFHNTGGLLVWPFGTEWSTAL